MSGRKKIHTKGGGKNTPLKSCGELDTVTLASGRTAQEQWQPTVFAFVSHLGQMLHCFTPRLPLPSGECLWMKGCCFWFHTALPLALIVCRKEETCKGTLDCCLWRRQIFRPRLSEILKIHLFSLLFPRIKLRKPLTTWCLPVWIKDICFVAFVNLPPRTPQSFISIEITRGAQCVIVVKVWQGQAFIGTSIPSKASVTVPSALMASCHASK